MHVSLTTTYNRRFPNMHMIYTVTFMFEKKPRKYIMIYVKLSKYEYLVRYNKLTNK